MQTVHGLLFPFVSERELSVQKRHESISVIIPTLNAEPWLDALLTRLSRQTVRPVEILVVDSGSLDQTQAVCRQHGVSLLVIPQQEFDHGGTRTMAAKKARGDLLVFLTQDALPVDDCSLQKLTQPLLADEQVAAAYGRQLAWPGASLISEHLRLFNYPEVSFRRWYKDRHLYGFKTIFISNSFAAYRKKLLADAGYFPDRLIFGEDTCAAAQLLQNGWCVQYVHDACVYHSHDYTFFQDCKRYFDIGVLHTSQKKLFAPYGSPGGTGKKYVLSEIRFLLRKKAYIVLIQSMGRTVAKYVAYAAGKQYQHLPRFLTRALSMHRHWW